MVERIAFAFINLEMPTISMGKLKNYLFVKEQGGVSAPHFYCGIQVSRGKLRIGSVSLAPKQAVRYHPSLHWLSDREVGQWGVFLFNHPALYGKVFSGQGML